jgi:hypothetical protein
MLHATQSASASSISTAQRLSALLRPRPCAALAPTENGTASRVELAYVGQDFFHAGGGVRMKAMETLGQVKIDTVEERHKGGSIALCDHFGLFAYGCSVDQVNVVADVDRFWAALRHLFSMAFHATA